MRQEIETVGTTSNDSSRSSRPSTTPNNPFLYLVKTQKITTPQTKQHDFKLE